MVMVCGSYIVYGNIEGADELCVDLQPDADVGGFYKSVDDVDMNYCDGVEVVVVKRMLKLMILILKLVVLITLVIMGLLMI